MKNRHSYLVRKYMRELRHALPFIYSDQRKILQSIKHNLSNYIEEHPNTDYSGLIKEFGSPLDTAASFMSEETFSEALRKRKKTAILVIATILSCTAVILGYCAYLADTTPMYIDQVTYIYDDTEVLYNE